MESTNNLAYLVRVVDLRPIPGKDLIVLAVVKGWKCIVKKDEFKVGDLAVYLAIGSVPDFEDPHFAFLKQKGFNRIKTVKMGGVVSQGLLGPISWITDRAETDVSTLSEGDDVSGVMGVTKFIPPEENAQYEGRVSNGVARAPFPDCVPKTDATRLQHDPTYFIDSIRDGDVVITRKEDGCSCTFVVNDGVYMLCGRNFVWNDDEAGTFAHYFNIQDRFGLKDKLPLLGKNIAIQGEIVGPKINGNRLKLTGINFAVFDIYDIDTQEYYNYDAMCNLCEELGLPTVPLLYRGPAAGLDLSVDGFLGLAERTEYSKGVPAEGIVVRSDTPTGPPGGGRVVFKAISNKYLMKHDL
jgi:RNA ligase (TIGR02306 family)